MEKIGTAIPEVFLLKPRVFSDDRGFFLESFHAQHFAQLGINPHFVQDNHSRSMKGTLRGLHYQLKHPQAKLCRVVAGEVLDVAVDIRRGSPTFGQHITARLSEGNQHLIFVPPGFAHGFLVLSPAADFLYKCSDFYRPNDEYGVAWNDPELQIPWNITDPILSSKDNAYPRLANIPADLLPVYGA